MKVIEIKTFTNKTSIIFTCIFCGLLFYLDSFAQNQIIPSSPKPSTLQPPEIIRNEHPNIHKLPYYRPGISIQEQNNQYIMEEVEQHQRQMMMKQNQVQETFEYFEPRQEINMNVCKTEIPLPDFSSQPGTEYFQNAFNEINKMLSGEVPISLKDAVFLAENAYLGNRMSYTDYNNKIKEKADLCRAKIWEFDLNPNNNEVKNMMLFHYMTDTFKLKLTSSENTLINYPVKYDFDDFAGRKDITKQFVTKLMAENSGQCGNMPMFYLIMAEELGTEAYLSRSPNHTFIKIKDNDGYWHNLELTIGAIINDNHYLSSGFIKAEALRNKIYLEPLTQQETLALIMHNLASYYVRKYGYDDFVKQCTDSALKYHSNSLSALMLQANYHTSRAMYVIERTGATSMKQLSECPQAYGLYQKMHQSYKIMDDLGYEEMPPEIYMDWLESVNKEKEKPENQLNNFPLKQIIK